MDKQMKGDIVSVPAARKTPVKRDLQLRELILMT
jgi:hypothetical protein